MTAIERLRQMRDAATDRDALGRLVREAWVKWALTQTNPKPSWLVPYDELSEPDKEADRQIGEAIAAPQLAELLADALGALSTAMPIVHKAQVAATMDAINASPDDPTAKTREVWRAKCLDAEGLIAAVLARAEPIIGEMK